MQSQTKHTLLFGILFLFLLQSLSDFIQSIYSFGLLVTAFTAEIASVILLFTSLILLFLRRSPSRVFFLILLFIAVLGRLVEPVLDPGGRLVACGVSVGAFMVLLPALLHQHKDIDARKVAGSLALAVALSILFRTAASGLDLSGQGIFQVLGWALGLSAIFLAWRLDWSAGQGREDGQAAASSGRITGLAIGMAAIILMIYFAFASPTVIARWTGYSYPAIVITLAASLVLFMFLLRSQPFNSRLNQRFLLGWNALFIISVVLTILPHQVLLPLDPTLYPIDAPASPSWAAIPLFLMLFLWPVLFVDFGLLAREISLQQPSLRQLGGAFATAAFFLLVMVFFHVFTTIYDYAPVIGPLFRDRFWSVYLLAGIGLFLPLLLRKKTIQPAHLETAQPFSAFLMAGLAALIVIALPLTAARPGATLPATEGLKIMTYNIQQGFDKAGNQGITGQLAVIRSIDPDILGLQESDTARIANGNADAVRFMVDNLDMYSYYGPTTTTGTFGIALLSKYPIQNPGTFFMFSEGEQTATIHAQIEVEGQTYNVFVTHLGNSGPLPQLQNMLAHMKGLDRVVAMGDFNFRPTTEQYALMTGTLADSWLLRWPGGKEIPGYSPDRRIDHIFVSPGTQVLESEYSVHPASDHPYMWTVIAP